MNHIFGIHKAVAGIGQHGCRVHVPAGQLRDDGRRQSDVISEVINPDHPLAKFSVGNRDTLADLDGRPVRDDDFLMLFNADHEEAAFVLPTLEGETWRRVLDTARDGTDAAAAGAGDPTPAHGERHASGARYALHGRSLALLTRTASLP